MSRRIRQKLSSPGSIFASTPQARQAPGAPWAAYLGLGLATLLAPTQAALAFGDIGNGECGTFTTCTAGVYSSAFAETRYDLTSIVGGYAVPSELQPGLNVFQDQAASANNAPARAVVGEFCLNCSSGNPFHSSAVGRGRSDFAVNRAAANTSVGVSGTDNRGGGRAAHVQARTIGDAHSAWRDVWTFNTDGHFNSTIRLDGHSGTTTSNRLFPSTFAYGIVDTLGDWFYELKVWDVTNLSISSEFELGGPTLVGRVRDHADNANEQRRSFASTLTLDFDFMSGVQYVVTAQLGVQARNGREIDLYNTARLTDVALSNGASLSALSGHDYISTNVPEPQSTALIAAGLIGIALIGRRQRRG
jgi:hypothetical protein